jgi:hypothetical protein
LADKVEPNDAAPPRELGEEQPVDVHKPKPWHGFRGFLKEYLIIVVGVLTALGLEQAVEWLHWRHQVAHAEATLLPEVRSNLVNAYERVVSRPCMAARLAALRDQLLQPGPVWTAAPAPTSAKAQTTLEEIALGTMPGDTPMPPVYSSITRSWPDGFWQTALTSGAIDHMQETKAAFYASQYQGFAQLRVIQEAENSNKPRLSALAYDRRLSEAERTEYLALVGELNRANELIVGRSAQLIIAADKEGVRIKASDAKELLDRIGRGQRGGCFKPVPIPLAPG